MIILYMYMKDLAFLSGGPSNNCSDMDLTCNRFSGGPSLFAGDSQSLKMCNCSGRN